MKHHQVAVIAQVMPGNQKKFHLAEFTLDAQGKILACPQGAKPDKVKKSTSGYSASFPVATYLECPAFDRCPVSKGKKACYYRYRAGVEATMSEFDRRTGVKHLRVRGMKAVRFAAIMKAIGLNILRASRIRGRKNTLKGPHRGSLWLLLTIWSLFKELVQQRFLKHGPAGRNFQPTGSIRMELAVCLFTTSSKVLKSIPEQHARSFCRLDQQLFLSASRSPLLGVSAHLLFF